MNIQLLPVFSFYDPRKAEESVKGLLHAMQAGDFEHELCLALRSSLDIFSRLSTSCREQMEPFLRTGRISILPDSLNGSFDGLLNKRELRRELKASVQKFNELFPGSRPVFMPRWHDAYRSEALEAYLSELPGFLLPLEREQDLELFSLLPGEGRIVPGLSLEGMDPLSKRFPSRLSQMCKKAERSISGMIEAQVLSASGPANLLLLISWDGADPEIHALPFLKALSQAMGKNFGCASGTIPLSGLKIEDNNELVRRTDGPSPEGLRLRVRPAEFDPPSSSPVFLGQLFPSSYPDVPGRSGMTSSCLLDFPPIPQRVEGPRPEREVTASMLGNALLTEGKMEARFTSGNLDLLAHDRDLLEMEAAVQSAMLIRKNGRERRTGFTVESAFAIENDNCRGLRQTMSLASPEIQISGRITNDFIIIHDSPWLYLDSYIQHPWMGEGSSIVRYLPQSLHLWTSQGSEDHLFLQSLNCDGSFRKISISPSDCLERRIILLPGCSWLLSMGNSSLGIELIFGQKLRINMPACLIIEPLDRHRRAVFFAPGGEHPAAPVEQVNGLLEHYTLRMQPGIRQFDGFPAVERRVYRELAEPFMIYY